MRKSVLFLAIILFCSFSSQAVASTLFLESWGVSKGNWTPTSAPSVNYWVQEDVSGGPYIQVTPGYGGQLFDAEAAYIAFEGTKTYIAVITGLPQVGGKDFWRYDNPDYASWRPGDWGTSNEKYWYDPGDLGIAINGIYKFAITTRPDNNQSSYAPTPGAGYLVSGNIVWENPKAWDYNGNYTNWGGVSNPWAVVGYDNAVNLGANFRYSQLGTSDSYVIEAILDNSLLGINYGDIFKLHWTEECGNDAIDVQGAAIPEPCTMLLLGSWLASIAFYRKRKA